MNISFLLSHISYNKLKNFTVHTVELAAIVQFVEILLLLLTHSYFKNKLLKIPANGDSGQQGLAEVAIISCH